MNDSFRRSRAKSWLTPISSTGIAPKQVSENAIYLELTRDVVTAWFAKRLHLRRAIDSTIFHHEVDFLQALNIM